MKREMLARQRALGMRRARREKQLDNGLQLEAKQNPHRLKQWKVCPLLSGCWFWGRSPQKGWGARVFFQLEWGKNSAFPFKHGVLQFW